MHLDFVLKNNESILHESKVSLLLSMMYWRKNLS